MKTYTITLTVQGDNAVEVANMFLYSDGGDPNQGILSISIEEVGKEPAW